MPHHPDHGEDDGADPEKMKGGTRDGERDAQDDPCHHEKEGEPDEAVTGFHGGAGERVPWIRLARVPWL